MDRCAAMAERVAGWFAAASRPDDMFGAVFFDLRERAKALKEKWSQEAASKLARAVRSDLSEKGHEIVSFNLSLGKYRGSRFVTSAKLEVKVKDKAGAERLAGYLRAKFSPKFALKDIADGVAHFNIR